MAKITRALAVCFAALAVLLLGPYGALAQEVRFALVVGNDQYRAGTLATPANDAGLVADALGAAGFAVTGARNLDQAALRESFREFIGHVASAGPNAVAVVYLAGFGLQFEGENYFVPVDADIQRDVDVPLQAVRVSDFTQPLAALPGRVKIVVLDAARQNPFARAGRPLAGGLALVEPQPGLTIAFNAAPGSVAPDEPGPYGAFATALTEMIGSGGLALDDMFARVRLRVSTQTQGAEVPWYASRMDGPFFMTERTADAPPPPNALPIGVIRNRPFREYGNPDEAYAAAVAIDSIDAYEGFLAVYPDSPYSRRVAAMLALRREEIIWRRCVIADTPPAYWSYLRRYPNGPHAWDARRRLAFLAAALEPPPDFAFFDFGIAPPPPTELIFVERPVIIFAGPGFAPPPPAPLIFLPPRPREFVVMAPPPATRERFALPITAAPIPAFVRPPRSVTVLPQRQPGATGPAGSPTTFGGRAPVNVTLPAAVSPANQGAPSTPGGVGLASPPKPGPAGVASPTATTPATPLTPPASTALPHPGGRGGPPSSASTGPVNKPALIAPQTGAPGGSPSSAAPANTGVKQAPLGAPSGPRGSGPAGANAPGGPAGQPAALPSDTSIKPPPAPRRDVRPRDNGSGLLGNPTGNPAGASSAPPTNLPGKPTFQQQQTTVPSAAAIKPPPPPQPPPQLRPTQPAPTVIKPPPPPPPPPPRPAASDTKAKDHPGNNCPPGKTATPNGCR
jgi:uncharacterized caspase-like protein